MDSGLSAGRCVFRSTPHGQPTAHRRPRLGDWAEWLEARESGEEAFRAIRESTRTGRLLGDETFMHGIEYELGLDLKAKPIARPRKQLAKAAGKGDHD